MWFILESEMFNCGNGEPGEMKQGKISQHSGVTPMGKLGAILLGQCILELFVWGREEESIYPPLSIPPLARVVLTFLKFQTCKPSSAMGFSRLSSTAVVKKT